MVLVSGAGGAIGGHLVKRLLADGHEVLAVDVKRPVDWWQLHETETWYSYDLSHASHAREVCKGVDTVYHLAADMGGLGFLGKRENDCAVLLGNGAIDIAVFEAAKAAGVRRFIYASSACVYPERWQERTDSAPLKEEDAYPAWPDLEYGWQKLISERMLGALKSETFRPLAVRFHNVFGPFGAWTGGREKAPAAMCRKVAEAKRDGRREIEVWGDGQARRSYLYVDDCVEGLIRLAATDETEPINLGSDRSVSVDELALLVADLADWPPDEGIALKHVPGPEGVRGRNADISRLRSVLGWEPQVSLEDGLRETYRWIEAQVAKEGQ